jgi:hypothetical protein
LNGLIIKSLQILIIVCVLLDDLPKMPSYPSCCFKIFFFLLPFYQSIQSLIIKTTITVEYHSSKRLCCARQRSMKQVTIAQSMIAVLESESSEENRKGCHCPGPLKPAPKSHCAPAQLNSSSLLRPQQLEQTVHGQQCTDSTFLSAGRPPPHLHHSPGHIVLALSSDSVIFGHSFLVGKPWYNLC